MKKNFRKLFMLMAVIAFAMVCFAFSASALSSSGKCGTNVSYSYNSSTKKLVIKGSGAMTNYDGSSSPFRGSDITSVVIESGVTSIGDYAFSYCYYISSVTIPSTVKTIGYCSFYYCDGLTSITIPSGVTTISSSAFYYCDGLTSITIPSSVTSIGSYAFYRCESLRSVTIGSGVASIGNYAFASCYNLSSVYASDLSSWLKISFSEVSSNPMCYAKNLYFGNTLVDKVVIPDSVTAIKNYTFYGLDCLESITIGSGVASIDNYALYCCKNLENITVNNNNSYYSSDSNGVMFNKNKTKIVKYPSGKKEKSYIIPDGVTSIGDYAFYYCDTLENVTIGDGVTSIGSYAFYNCESLRSVTIGDGVTSIGSYAFYYCGSLTDIIISDSVSTINSYAFSYCDALENVTIGSKVNTINYDAFSGCDNLKNVYAKDLSSWLKIQFSNATSNPMCFAVNLYFGNELAKDVVIPDSVTTVKNYTFYGADCVESLKIPSSVTSIGSGAITNCTGLKSITVDESNNNYSSDSNGVLFNKDKTKLISYPIGKEEKIYTIPDGVTSLGPSTFYYCDNLENIIIPDGFTTIESYTFYYCDGLAGVTIPDSVSNIKSNAFKSDVVLFCKKASYAASWAAENKSPYVITDGSDAENIISGVTGSLSYTFDKRTGVLEIIGSGKIPTYSSQKSPWYSNRYYIREVKFFGAITSVGSYAFQNCTNIESITIPAAVTSIENYAFYGCTRLRNAKIGKGVSSIGNYAFGNCTGLESIIIPGSVTSIGSDAFSECSSLKDVYADNLSSWLEIQFGDEASNPMCYAENLYFGNELVKSVTIPDTVTAVKGYAFYGAECIENLIVSEGVTSIGARAFYGCTSLEDVLIPDGVTEIGVYAFSGCKSLENVTVPDSVATIGSSAFSGCNTLKSITLPFIGKSATLSQYIGYIFGASDYSNNKSAVPESLKELIISDKCTSIAKNALYGCENIKKLTLPFIGGSASSYRYLGYIFGASDYSNNGSYVPSSLEELIISDKCTSIAQNAFYGCKDLVSIIIPDSVKTIGSYAFFSCMSLREITIPASVSTINSYTFFSCSNLEKVKFNYNVKTISPYVFNGCKSLKEVYFFDPECSIDIYCGLTEEQTIYGYADSTAEAFAEEIGAKFIDVETVHIHNFTSEITTSATHLTEGVKTFTCSCGYFYTKTVDKLEGHNYSKETTEPTCTEKGYTIYVCECGDTYKDDEVDELGHDEITHEAKSATCKEIGWNEYVTCSRCDYTTYEEVPLADHPYTAAVTAPTCTEKGYTTYTCECGDTYKGDEVDALGHDEITHEAKSATCTETGWNEYVTCSRCDYTTYIEIESTGHHHTSAVTAPTCTEKGYTTYTCECGDSYKVDEVDSLGHDEISHEAKSATCTEIGWKEYVTCSRCDYTTYKEISQLGHDEIINEAKAPTCTEFGWDEYVVCSRCDYTTYKKIPSTGHSYKPTVTAPTCTENGFTTYTCKCGDSYVADETENLGHSGGTANCKDKAVCKDCGEAYGEINAENHKSVIVDKAVDATCQTTGLTEGAHCEACGVVIREQTETPVLSDHFYEKTVKEPTCTEDGCAIYTCACGDSYTEVIEKLSHSFEAVITKATLTENGKTESKCTACGFVESTSIIYRPETINLSSGEVTYNGKVRTPSVTVKDSQGVALVKDADYTVTYESGRKLPGQYAITVNFKGNYEGTKTLIFTILPKAPTTISATQSTSVIKLTWSASEGATGYRVYQYSPSKGKYVSIASVKGETSYRKSTSLKAGTQYSFKIKPYTKLSDGTVLWGVASDAFVTATECKAPSITSVTSSSTSKATVKWSDVSGETGYQLYYATSKNGTYKKIKSYGENVVAASKTFSASASGKTIYFKVRSYSKVNGQTIFSEWSAVKSVKLK